MATVTVPSSSRPGTVYVVRMDTRMARAISCTCPAWQFRQAACRHMQQAEAPPPPRQRVEGVTMDDLYPPAG